MGRPSLNHQVGMKLLKEGNKQLGGIFSAMLQNNQRHRDQHAGQDLISNLRASRKPKISPMDNLKIVIGEADRAKRQGRKHSDPDKRITEVRPQQSRNQNGDRNQQTAHGRSTRFFLMRLRTLFANILPNLKVAQSLNHDRPDNQPREKRRQTGKRRAKSQITKNTERRKIMEELQVEQPIEQSASIISCQLSAVSSQLRTPRA